MSVRRLALLVAILAACPLARAQDSPPDLPPDLPPTDAPADAAPGAREPGYLGLIADDRQENGRGVRIVEVVAGGPGETAGLEVGDLVTAINRQPIRDMKDVARIIETSMAGDKLDFRIERQGQVLEKQVVLGRRPPRDQRRFGEFGQIPGEPPATAPGEANVRRPWLGVRARPLTLDVQQALGVPVPTGAWVTEVIPDSPAARVGMSVDAVIVRFGGQPVDGPGTLGQLVAAADVREPTKVEFYQRGQLQKVDMQLIEIERPAAEAPAPPVAASVPPGDADRIAMLEQQVRELEARLARIEDVLRAIAEQQGAAPPRGNEPPGPN